MFFHSLVITRVLTSTQLHAFQQSLMHALMELDAVGGNLNHTLVNITVLSSSAGNVAVDLIFNNETITRTISNQISDVKIVYDGGSFAASTADLPSTTPTPSTDSTNHTQAIVFAACAGSVCLIVLGYLVSTRKRYKAVQPTPDPLVMETILMVRSAVWPCAYRSCRPRWTTR